MLKFMRTNAVHQWLASGSSPPPPLSPQQASEPAESPNNSNSNSNNNNNNKAALSQVGKTKSDHNNRSNVVKVFVAQSLSQNVEYVCLRLEAETNCKQIVKSLLKKFKLKHRDPNLYYLTLERWIRKDGLKFKSVILLGDDACPLQLQQCCSNPPHNDIKFTLQNRTGALIRVFCSDVAPDTKYKCLSLSPQTTVNDTIELMLHCLNLIPQQPRPSRRSSIVNPNESSSQNDCDAPSQTRMSDIQCNAARQQHNHTPDLNYNHIVSHQRTTQTTNSSLIIDKVRELTNQSPNSTGSIDTNSSATSSYSTSSNAAVLISNDTSSTSSGIESESTAPINNALLATATGRADKHEPPEARHLADTYSSHTGSITSISSLVVDNNANSYCDQYCLLFEGAIEGNFKRQILDPMDLIVDIYEKSLSNPFEEDSSNTMSQLVDTGSLKRHNSHTRPVSQSSFKFILQRRNKLCTIDPQPPSLAPHIMGTISRQNMPLPAIPVDAVSPVNAELQSPSAMVRQQLVPSIVSTTQIEVNTLSGRVKNVHHTHSQSVVMPHSNDLSGFRSGSGRFDSRLANINSTKQLSRISDCYSNYDRPVTRRTNTDLSVSQTGTDVVDAASISGSRLPPPPKFIYLAPPIRPRRRNLSNASSTFGRPPTTAIIRETTHSFSVGGLNGSTSASSKLIEARRHYTPAQLADDLSKLDVSSRHPTNATEINVIESQSSIEQTDPQTIDQVPKSTPVHESDINESPVGSSTTTGSRELGLDELWPRESATTAPIHDIAARREGALNN